jgi:hypothetical protein
MKTSLKINNEWIRVGGVSIILSRCRDGAVRNSRRSKTESATQYIRPP